jgi:hypothetical protein
VLLAFDETNASATLRARKDLHVIDTAAMVKAIGWPTVPAGVTGVLLDHFAYRMDDASSNDRKLEFIERLRRKHPDVMIVILSTVDPLFYFGVVADAEQVPDPELAVRRAEQGRWTSALDGFVRYRVDEEVERNGDALRARLPWWACTTNEKLALYQLAHDGWANPKNRAALLQLERRGIITGRPYRFVDPAFGRFVLEEVGKRERRSWEQHLDVNIWEGIRLMFVVLFLGVVAALLFFNQQSILGYVVTAAGLLTPLTRLLSQADTVRTALRFKSEDAKA